MRLIVTAFRTVLTWVVGVSMTVICALIVLAITVFNDTARVIDEIILIWSRSWMWASGTHLTVEGREHIDPSRSYVVVANHLSTLDIMACFLATRLPIRYLAKKELFRIPILAQGMRAVGVIEVDRAARGAIHSQVNRAAKKLIEANRSLIIYAEGTRPRDGIMRPFKKGAFTMAIASGLPVLPMSIHGTYEAAPSGRPWFHGGNVKVIIDKEIETADLTQANTGELRDEVYAIISQRVREMGGAVGG
ncbi:MAG: lysophospholipid acyltransferase family protein [Acidimicrobiia bacterium]